MSSAKNIPVTVTVNGCEYYFMFCLQTNNKGKPMFGYVNPMTDERIVYEQFVKLIQQLIREGPNGFSIEVQYKIKDQEQKNGVIYFAKGKNGFTCCLWISEIQLRKSDNIVNFREDSAGESKDEPIKSNNDVVSSPLAGDNETEIATANQKPSSVGNLIKSKTENANSEEVRSHRSWADSDDESVSEPPRESMKHHVNKFQSRKQNEIIQNSSNEELKFGTNNNVIGCIQACGKMFRGTLDQHEDGHVRINLSETDFETLVSGINVKRVYAILLTFTDRIKKIGNYSAMETILIHAYFTDEVTNRGSREFGICGFANEHIASNSFVDYTNKSAPKYSRSFVPKCSRGFAPKHLKDSA